MSIIKLLGKKKGYILHKITDNNILLCRIIKEYNSIEQAKDGLTEILTKKKKRFFKF